jgi:tRNA 2-thiouridine synthesizing protein A
MTAYDTIDCEGLLCPLPVLKARKRLLHMQPGEVLRIRATDPMAAIDMPHFCTEAGHSLLETRQEGAVQIYTIRRGLDKI